MNCDKSSRSHDEWALNLSCVQGILQESPLATVILPDCSNRVAVCNTCLRFVGPLSHQMRLAAQPPITSDVWLSSPLAGQVSVVCSAPLPMLADEDQSEPLERCNRCGSAYCSVECLAADEAHAVLCGSWATPSVSPAAPSPWKSFEAFCIENSETYLFAARLAAILLHRTAKSEGCVAAGADRLPGVFHAFTQPLWWEILPVPDTIKYGPSDAIESFRSSIRADAEIALRLFCACLPESLQPTAAAMLTVDVWGRLLGIITQNALSVKISSPLTSYLLSVAGTIPHPVAVSASSTLQPVCHCIVAADAILKRINDDDVEEDEVVGPPAAVTEADMVECLRQAFPLTGKRLMKKAALASPHLQGSALFSLFSCFNHSCVPNCTVKFNEDATCVVVALRDIVAGEELTISYIEEDLPIDERESELFSYQFVCQCKRCVEERK